MTKIQKRPKESENLWKSFVIHYKDKVTPGSISVRCARYFIRPLEDITKEKRTIEQLKKFNCVVSENDSEYEWFMVCYFEAILRPEENNLHPLDRKLQGQAEHVPISISDLWASVQRWSISRSRCVLLFWRPGSIDPTCSGNLYGGDSDA